MEDNNENKNNVSGIEFNQTDMPEEKEVAPEETPVETEVAGGIEFKEETPIEASAPIVIKEKPVEVSGGVEFAKPETKEEAPAPEQKEAVPQKDKFEDDAIHTMAEDMGEQVEKKQGAALQAVLQEEMRTREIKKRREKNLIFSLISVILFAAAIGLFFFATKEEPAVETVNNPIVQPSLIYSENHVRVDTTNVQSITLTGRIGDRVTVGDASIGEVTNIYFTKSLATGSQQRLAARDFLSAIQSSTPAALLPFLEKEFMLGVYSGNTRKPFLVFKTNSRNTLTYMKEWESTLLQDVDGIFDLEINNPGLYSKNFVDQEFQNKRLRSLLNEEGEIVISYSYLDEDLLVIFTEPITLQEILQRLATTF
jgi:hypothetical protein